MKELKWQSSILKKVTNQIFRWCPRTDSNRGPIDYKSKSFLKYPFINVDIINFQIHRKAILNYSLTIHLTKNLFKRQHF